MDDKGLVLACVFAGLSIDEFAGIHELLNRPLRAALHTGGLLYFPWVLVGAGVALTMVAAFGRLVLAQPPPVRSPLIVAAALFLSGAIGVEMLAAPYYETVGKATLIHSLLVTLEEFLEMSGVAVFIYARCSISWRLNEHSSSGASAERCPRLPFGSPLKPPLPKRSSRRAVHHCLAAWGSIRADRAYISLPTGPISRFSSSGWSPNCRAMSCSVSSSRMSARPTFST